MTGDALEREVAYYFPNPLWRDGDWIKNLILFFDGVAVLVPRYMRDKVADNDPAIVAALRARDMLFVIEPEEAVDRAATAKLATALADVIASGVLDDLGRKSTTFHQLSMSRLGWHSDPGIAEMIFDELHKRNLARPSEDGHTIPMHPRVRYLVLVLLSQILRPYGRHLGVELCPATDRTPLVDSLGELIANKPGTLDSSVVSFDMNTVGVDVSSIPLDELLDFRARNANALSTYRRSVKLYAAEISVLPEEARQAAFETRVEQLRDLSADLSRASRKAWRKRITFALGLTGAAWSAYVGNPVGAALSLITGISGYTPEAGPKLGAYSYVFRAAGNLRRRPRRRLT